MSGNTINPQSTSRVQFKAIINNINDVERKQEILISKIIIEAQSKFVIYSDNDIRNYCFIKNSENFKLILQCLLEQLCNIITDKNQACDILYQSYLIFSKQKHSFKAVIATLKLYNALPSIQSELLLPIMQSIGTEIYDYFAILDDLNKIKKIEDIVDIKKAVRKKNNKIAREEEESWYNLVKTFATSNKLSCVDQLHDPAFNDKLNILKGILKDSKHNKKVILKRILEIEGAINTFNLEAPISNISSKNSSSSASSSSHHQNVQMSVKNSTKRTRELDIGEDIDQISDNYNNDIINDTPLKKSCNSKYLDSNYDAQIEEFSSELRLHSPRLMESNTSLVFSGQSSNFIRSNSKRNSSNSSKNYESSLSSLRNAPRNR